MSQSAQTQPSTVPAAEPAPQNDTALILELLASRICHDLISPVGAVNNGVEYLQDSGPDAMGEGLELIAYSAAQASAKLQAFRLCYGAGGRDPNIKFDEVHRIFGEYIGKDSRVRQDWSPADIRFEETLAGLPKILLGTLILATEIMPRGGTITVTKTDSTLTVTPTGQDVALRPNMDKALDGTVPLDILDTRLIHAKILNLMAKNCSFSVEPSMKGEILSFNIKGLN